MTNDRNRTERALDLTIDIDATLEEVWQALTTGEGIARWFGPYAAVTPGEGGSVSVGWDPKEMWDTPITVWEPLRRMQTASEMPSKDGRMVRLAVDYYLEVQGGRVRVRLVHSGFDDSDRRRASEATRPAETRAPEIPMPREEAAAPEPVSGKIEPLRRETHGGDLDSALQEELKAPLVNEPETQPAAEPSLEEEMKRLLGELSMPARS